MIRRDGIDILVDLAGHTALNRLGVFARKPAALQVSWLGYPDTVGLATIDARVTDAIADPAGSDSFAMERLMRLPGGFLCYGEPEDAPDVAPLPAGTDGPVTFGSFCNLSKMTDRVLGLWAEVLQAVPRARLLLKARSLGDAVIRRDTAGIFARYGIAEDRVQLAGHISGYRDHMAAYNDVDIALDTFPYNGTTTICEALWMGVPTVTLKGDRHSARVGESLLTRIGLPDLVAANAEDYVRIAARLAEDRPRLAVLRSGMRDRMRKSPLMDAARFTANLEAAYRELWCEWCARAP
jgi:predicted O-linked N-acetylglucosamine transferase (SPINDLY family)